MMAVGIIASKKMVVTCVPFIAATLNMLLPTGVKMIKRTSTKPIRKAYRLNILRLKPKAKMLF